MDRYQVATIIPAYNEEKTVGDVVSSALPFGYVIVVNDCSSDFTAEIAEAAGAIVLNHKDNQGYDVSLNTGFNKANQLGVKYVVTLDADGQHPSELLESFIDSLERGYELVLGVRHEYPRIGEKIFGMLTKILYGIKDPLCGMKGYDLKLYKKFRHFDSYGSIGTELALKAVKKRHKFVQIFIPIRKRVDTPRFGNRLKSNLKIIRSLILSLYK